MWQVAVCGPGECTPQEAETARAVGRLLAEHGAVVLCGGYGGVMAAAAAGAREGGGVAVGVLSGRDRSGASQDLTVALPTGMGEARNALIVRAADAVVVVGGSWGTLSELALARRGGTPVITLGGWRVLDAEGRPVPGPVAAAGPDEAVRLALAAARGAGPLSP
ncbi:TIGR00725 family protein [Microbispora sp. H11081]|uniref:TIGR00725 family protein n=1 Tax=Microbispora sp. H11081 TaxID=2729107 RepID=UPI001474BB37|nr:TIGR00725 family protein [Microbispora sp. H11081]